MQKMFPTLADRCTSIELLVLDVDGVLTAGGINLAGADLEIKTFNTRDGAGLKLWRRAGKRAAVITGRDSPAVLRRAREVGIDMVVQGVDDKLTAFSSIVTGAGLRNEQAAAMGDDLPDLPVLEAAGLAVAVPNACTELRRFAHYVTQTPGGAGAVREVIELILRCQGAW